MSSQETMELLNHAALSMLTKAQIVTYALNLQANVIAKFNKLEQKVELLESEIEIMKTVNNNLLNENKLLFKKQCAQEQYSRRECIEISGIPSVIEDDTLESKTCLLFQEMGCDVSPENLESVHRIKHNRTIVKFKSRKDVNLVMAKKKLLKDLNLNSVFDTSVKLFINESLCGYYKRLWSKAKALLNKGKIARSHVSQIFSRAYIYIHDGSLTV